MSSDEQASAWYIDALIPSCQMHSRLSIWELKAFQQSDMRMWVRGLKLGAVLLDMTTE